MDFRFKVLVAVNLDLDTAFKIGEYSAFKVKSIKVGDLKTLDVAEYKFM